jgi:phospholipid transport system transporter-binding protein
MLEVDNSHLKLSGAILMDSVGKLLDNGRARCAANDVVLDFSGATEVDSSALALILEYRRAAESAGKRLSIVNVPASLKTLADLYGVTDLIAATP